MRVRHNILNISLFMALHSYDPAMLWDVKNDIFKRETPAIRERVKEILIIKE